MRHVSRTTRLPRTMTLGLEEQRRSWAEPVLNPHEMAHLQRRVEQAADRSLEAAQHGFRADPIRFGRAAGLNEIFAEQPTSPAQFPPPAFIQGQPVEPWCLQDIGRTIGDIPRHSILKVENACVAGWQTLLDKQGTLYIDGIPVETDDQLKRLHNYDTGFHNGFFILGNEVGHPEIYHKAQSRDIDLDGVGVFVPGLEPGNYGSFLFRMLPVLLLIGELDLAIDYLIVAERTSWMMQALEFARLGHLRTFSMREVAGLNCRQILVPHVAGNEGFIDSLSVERFRRLSKRCRDTSRADDPRSDKIYVSRALSTLRSPNYRRLLNEEDIERIVSRRGFAVVYPETLSFGGQVALFGAARTIVGPSGSGMLNAAFAPSGAGVIDLESFTFTVRQHAKIYASTGKVYGFLFGVPEDDTRTLHLRNWSVDLELFNSALDIIEAA
jgi:capsular polysaccharide biosynthesis protein